MREKEDLLARFTSEELTPKFRALLDLYFDASVQPCTGCELRASDSLHYMFPRAELYARNGHRFVIIGQATGTGSDYVLLRPETPGPVDEWPVVVSDDEGGVGVLAENLDGWLRYLTLDVEPFVEINRQYDPATNTATYTTEFDLSGQENGRVDHDEDGYGPAAYRKWLQATYGLAAVTSPEQAIAEIIAPAQQRYQAEVDRLVNG